MTDSDPAQRAYRFLQALASDLSNKQISFPTFTGATIRVRSALADPAIDAERLAHVISAEPLLPARLIQIANSVAMNPGGKPISDVRNAVMRVGHDVVRSTAVALAMEQLRAAKDVQVFHEQAEWVWRHSLEVAAISYVMAKKESRLSVQYVWRIMRKLEGANDPVMVKQINAGNEAIVFVDTTIEWEKNYQYWITPVTLWQNGSRKGEVEGDDSPIVTLLAHDSFPPAAPSGVQAVYSAVPERPFIDLTWTPNMEPDLAGYNVYRHVANQPPVKINSELVKTPRFADPEIQKGMKYFYSVSAVDLRGNESGQAEETSETVPKE